MQSYYGGARLAFFLVDGASANGAPVIDLVGLDAVEVYVDSFAGLEDLRTAADSALVGQRTLSTAFDEALQGMPDGTERTMARFGASMVTIGLLAATQYSRI